MTRIAVDAFGGDYAPEQIVEGALQAAHEDGIDLILTGIRPAYNPIQGKPGSERIKIVHAPDVIGMDEAAEAVRSKPESSLLRLLGSCRKARQGPWSPGSTGATMAASVLTIRRIKEWNDQPLPAMPTRTGVTLMVDVGANVDCKPNQLLQFAQMGSIYAEHVLKVRNQKLVC